MFGRYSDFTSAPEKSLDTVFISLSDNRFLEAQYPTCCIGIESCSSVLAGCFPSAFGNTIPHNRAARQDSKAMHFMDFSLVHTANNAEVRKTTRTAPFLVRGMSAEEIRNRKMFHFGKTVVLARR